MEILLLVHIARNGAITIRPQLRKSFWQTTHGSQVYQKPDIVIERNGGKKIILDTKWKLIHDRPSEDDLRQMFAYNRLFNARLSYLVYRIRPTNPIFQCFK